MFRLLDNGGFVVGDPVTGRTSYAEPASMNAKKARGEATKYGTFTLASIAENVVVGLQDGHPARETLWRPGRDLTNWAILMGEMADAA